MDTSTLMLEQTFIIMHNDIEDNMLVINKNIGQLSRDKNYERNSVEILELKNSNIWNEKCKCNWVDIMKQ